MSVFYANFIGTYRKQFAYRLPTISACVSSIITVFAQIALWSYLYSGEAAKTTYMIAYVVLARVLSCLHDSNIAKSIESRVRSGDLAIDLIRPVNTSVIFWSEALGKVAARLLLSGLPILAVFGFAFFRLNISFSELILFLLAAVLGCLMYNALYMMIGYIAFVVVMNWPYIRIANDTLRLLSGSVVPIALFPSFLQTISWCVPFRFLYAFPIDLLIGDMAHRDIITGFLILLLWTLVLFGLLRITISKVEKHLVIQGG